MKRIFYVKIKRKRVPIITHFDFEGMKALLGSMMHYITEAPGELELFTNWVVDGLEDDFPDVARVLSVQAIREKISFAHEVLAPDCDTPIEKM